MDIRRIDQLRPHPENEKIYGDHADSELIESVRAKGILNPLLIAHDGRIINGHRRFEAAKKCGMDIVPIVPFRSEDELDILEALIESNRQRQKTNEQIGREYAVLKRIYHDRENRQGNNQYVKPNVASGKSLPDARPSIQAAQSLGVSRPTADRAAAIVDVIDKLEGNGRKQEANEFRSILNSSVNKAYETAKKTGHIQPVKQAPELPKENPVSPLANQNYISLDNFKALSADEQSAAFEAENTGKKFNSQDAETSIEWAHWSWNPVTGCKHNCPYCYARDFANRIYPTRFEPTLWPERLYAPHNTPLPREAQTDIGYKNVFTCSMADLFGRWVPQSWIETVLQVIADNPQWNFLLLTKFPIRMAEFDFPDNAWVGTSVDCQIRVRPVEDAFSRVRAKVKWLSCEPMIEPLKFANLDMFSWVVIGGASKSTQTPEWIPPRVWVSDLEYQARQAGCMVYEKSNLQPIERLCEFPGQRANTDRQAPEALRYLPMAEHLAESE